MKDLSKADERRAMDALEGAIEQVGKGVSPNDALTKAAQDNKFTAPMTQRLIEAYNISKTLHHFKTEDGEKKASSFPVADPNVIFGALFPKDPETEQKKAASALHPDYLVGGVSDDFMKVADVELPVMVEKPPLPYERDPGAMAKRAFDGRNKLVVTQKRAAAEARSFYFKMLNAVDRAVDYWRQVGPREDFALVEKRAVATYGPVGQSLIDLIYGQGGLDDRRLNVKRASAEALDGREAMFDATQEPYNHVADAILMAKAATQWSKRAAQCGRAIHSHAIDNVGILPERQVVEALEFFDPPEEEPELPVEKSARDMPAFDKQDRPPKAKKMYNAMMHRPKEKAKMIKRYGSKDKAEQVAAATASKHGK